MENTSIITEKLLALGEPSYRDFSASLMPTVDPATVIGIRMPALRKLASELYGTPEAELFCRTLPHVYFEEYNLHGCLIEKRRSYEAVIEGLEALLPYIDNWATCDMISPPVFQAAAASPDRSNLHLAGNRPHIYNPIRTENADGALS